MLLILSIIVTLYFSYVVVILSLYVFRALGENSSLTTHWAALVRQDSNQQVNKFILCAPPSLNVKQNNEIVMNSVGFGF